MTSKAVSQNPRLLKRNTLREEKSPAVSKTNEGASDGDDANKHEAIIKCEVSTLGDRKLEPVLQKKSPVQLQREVFDGMPNIALSKDAHKGSLLKLACENDMRTRTPLTLPTPQTSPPQYPARPASTGRILPHIGYRGFKKTPNTISSLKPERQTLDGARNPSQQPAVPSRRHHVTQCTIDANNLQNLTVGGRLLATPPLKSSPSNSFPTRSVTLQSAMKHNKPPPAAAGGKFDPEPPAQSRVLSVHNLEMDQQTGPRPPTGDQHRGGIKQRAKTFHGARPNSTKRDVNVRNTHPPFPSRSGVDLALLSHDQR